MKKVFLYILFLSLSSIGLAQNNASPYSIIGLGDFEKSYYDRTAAMGHSGVAMVSEKFVLLSNPASLSFLMPSLYKNPFYVDIAANYKGVSYAGTPIKSNNNEANDLQFKKLSFTIKPTLKWGLSFGLLPYTNSSYSFSALKEVQGSNTTIQADYRGSGSTNLLYLSNSYLVNKKLSVGLQTSLLFGNLSKREIVYSAITDSVLSTDEETFVSKIMFKGGFIYKDTINKNWNFSIGGTGSLQTNVNANYNVEVKDGTTILKKANKQILNYTTLPKMFTTGFAVNYLNNFTLTADYTYQDWSSLRQSGLNYNITNYDKVGVGFQYKSVSKEQSAKKGETFYQIGYYTTSGYLNIANNNIKESAITVGLTKQFKDERFAVQLNAAFGNRGTTNNGLIKENFTNLGLTVNFRDFWFTKKIKRYN